MKIYLDYVFLINFLFDFILLNSISIILKRNIQRKRLIFGSFYGGLSTFIIFLNINSYLYFILKLITGLLMIIITFKYKNLKYTITNFIYLLILSIILGGSLYLINIEIGYDHIGIIFFTNGKKLNIIILIILSILIMIIYIKIINKHKTNINLYYKVDLYIQNKIIKLNAFLDTGNKLKDPYTNKSICIINKNILKDKYNYIYVPYKTINGSSIMKCIKIKKIYISKVGYKYNVLVGISNDNFLLEGVDIILNIDLLKGDIWKNYYYG